MKKNATVLWSLSAIFIFLLVSLFHTQSQAPKLQMQEDETSVGTKDDPEARLRYEWMMLRDPVSGQIPRNIRQREMEYARTLPTREQVASLNKIGGIQTATWASRGPWNVGGRTRALGIDVTTANTILAGGVSGGMWRSVNGGTSWTRTTLAGILPSASCLAQDTRTGQTSTWYYGTGEYLGNSAGAVGAPFSGDGIYKSVDGGATWALLPATATGKPHQFDNFFDYVWNVAVNPTNGHVYAATYGAIQRSTDGGVTWSVVLGGATTYSPLTDVQIDGAGVIYATGSKDGAIGGIWKSTTGAAGSWTNISPTDLPASTRRIAIAIAPSTNNTIYFIAETPSAGVNNHSMWKYDPTASPAFVNRSANMPAFGGSVGNFDSQGSYDLVVKVKPDNPNVVIIGGTNLYRSTDGFATAGNTTWIGGYSTANDISQYANHHPDNHSLAFMPGNPSVLISGHDGGVSKTSNILASPIVWTQLSTGYLTTQFYNVSLDHGTTGSNSILGGLQDNGCWMTTSSSATATWTAQGSGDGAFTAIADGGASIYASSQNGRTYRLVGSQFTRVDPGGTGYMFINPFILDPNNSKVMYMGRGANAMRNSDVTAIPLGSNDPATVNWTTLQNSVPPGTTVVSALAVSKANPTNRLYIGHNVGYIMKVDNANTGDPTGTDISGPLPSGNVSCIAVDPTNGNNVLVVFSNYNLVSLYYTNNGGTSWTDVEGNLAGTVVAGVSNGPSCRYAAIVPSGTTTTYYVGTSVGLYSTTTLNGSTTVWAQEGATSIGNVIVSSIDARTSDGVIAVGTHANGVFTNSGTTGGTTVNVFSGDANNDGTCDIRDILPIGRFFGSTGPVRTGGSLTWASQTAAIWTPPEATHADCDGNGTVNAADVQGIINNYSLTHASAPDSPVDRLAACNALLRSIDAEQTLSGPMKEIRSEIISYMKQTLGVSFSYQLAQNYPNPFNPSTTIKFTVPEFAAKTQLRVYNIAGQLLWEKTLSDVQVGNHEIVWNGESSNGTKVASGMYIYKLTAGNFSAAKRMLMIK
ncbi:MAG: FlgD immunoglobulin-like domain containing protein [bacterium]